MKKQVFQQFFKGLKGTSFEVTYWDGETESFGEGPVKFKLVFRDQVSIAQFIKEPVLSFGEGYMNGIIDVEDELEDVIQAANLNKSVFWSRALSGWAKLPSMRKQKEFVQHHYDVGNGFYALWLDPTMSYSCAYFRTPEDTLEQAQNQKIDHTVWACSSMSDKLTIRIS